MIKMIIYNFGHIVVLYLVVGCLLTTAGFIKQYGKGAIWTHNLCLVLKVFLFIVFMVFWPLPLIRSLGQWCGLNIMKCFKGMDSKEGR